MALGDHGILAVGKSVETAMLDALTAMVEEESELVTIYYGEDVSREDAERMKAKADKLFSNCEVELHEGGQPVYYYILSVE